jgi:dTDP-4-amino-4,6-dideoxygalactose transaminase
MLVGHRAILISASSLTSTDAQRAVGHPQAHGAHAPSRWLTVEPIRFQRPGFPSGADIEHYLAAAREARWFSNAGPCHRLLTERLTHFLGGESRLVLTANATCGLMLALRALVGQHPQRRMVVVPSFTFPATAQAIRWNGLEPLWVDVERTGWHLDPDQLGEVLDGRRQDIAAVLACSTFGTAPPPTQSAAWRQLCTQAGVPLIVDSAPGFGSRTQDGSHLGAQGTAEIFSFHATKPFAIGEGGAVTTTDLELAERLTAMTNFGFGPDREIGEVFGLNGKLSEIHCAVGLAVLDRFDSVLAARRERAERMRARLEPAGFGFQAGAHNSAWQFVPVLAPSPSVRDAVLSASSKQAIEIRTYHTPLDQLAAFASYPSHGELPVTRHLARHALSLPLANDLSEQAIERIVALLVASAETVPQEQAVGT